MLHPRGAAGYRALYVERYARSRCSLLPLLKRPICGLGALKPLTRSFGSSWARCLLGSAILLRHEIPLSLLFFFRGVDFLPPFQVVYEITLRWLSCVSWLRVFTELFGVLNTRMRRPGLVAGVCEVAVWWRVGVFCPFSPNNEVIGLQWPLRSVSCPYSSWFLIGAFFLCFVACNILVPPI